MNLQELNLLIRYTKPYHPRLLLITGLAIICAFFEAINLGALVPLLQLMESQEPPGGTLWDYLQAAFGLFGLELNFFNLLFALTGLFLLGQVLLFVKKTMEVRVRVDFAQKLKTEVFGGLFKCDINYHYSQKSGNLINLIVTEIDNAGFGIFAALELMTDIFFIAVYGIMLLYISIEMTLLCIGVALAGLIFMNHILKRSTAYGRGLVINNTQQHEFVTERFNLLRLIKTSSTEDLEHDRFGNITGQFRDAHVRYSVNGVSIEILFQSIIFLLAVMILFVSIEYFQLPLALLLVFIFILVRITAPLRDLNTRRHELARELASFEKVEQVTRDVKAAQNIRSGTKIFSELEREIELRHISYSYDKITPVLKNINLTIHKNEMVALVGASGGGKSTLVDLIIRLIDPDQGEILLDGINLKEFDLSSYRSRIGVVTQETFIFNDTVLNNICYGSDRISSPEAVEAAKIAHAHDFIAELKDGYDTVLGDRGVKLSGGQKQRIALARAIYKNPDILILDEATSALDSESEKVIQRSIAAIKKDYTIIAIAHRLSTIENADTIVVVENGEIKELGSPMELLQRGTFYKKYHAMQHGMGVA